MKALARYGKEFGGYRLIDVPEPEVGEEDLLVRVGAATICGADMKHFRVDNGSDEPNSKIRWKPLEAFPPACSVRNAIGLHS